MKLWKDNRKDGEWEISEEEIAKRFLKSTFGDDYLMGVNFRRALCLFISSNESEGGLQSIFEESKQVEAQLDKVAKIVLKLVKEAES